MSPIRSVLITLATLALCSSCTEQGSGFITSEQRQLKSFDKVEVSDGLSVTITNADQRVVVTTDDNLRNNIVTDVDGSTLKIRLARNESIDPTRATIEVSTLALQGLKVSGKSTVTAEGTQAEKWNLDVDDGSRAKVTGISAAKFEINVKDKSLAEVTGSTNEINIDCHDESAMNSEGMTATKAKVDISGQSQVNVLVTNDIEIDSSGNSRVFVSGNPPTRNVDADNGSSIVFNNQ